MSSRNPFAVALSEALSPVTLVGVLLAVVTFTAPGGTWLHFIVSISFSALLPYLGLYLAARAGRTTNKWVSKREQRTKVFISILTSIAVGVLLLWLLDAPGALFLAVGFFFGTLVLAAIINRKIKMSIHAMVSASLLGGLWPFVGAWALLAIPATAAVAWSRVELHEHEPREVLLGSVLGFFLGAPLGMFFTI